MKKLFLILIAFALVFAACGNGTTSGNDGDNNPPVTSLKITNQSSYELLDVAYSAVDFDNIVIGGNVTKDVTPDDPKYIYFYLRIFGTNIHCRTNELFSCDEGVETPIAIMNTTTVTAVDGGQTGTLKAVYDRLTESLSVASMELSQDGTIIANNNPQPFDFGKVPLNSSKSILFTMKSTGNVPLELKGTPVVTSTNAVFTIPVQPSNSPLDPEDSVSFLLQFNPTIEQEEIATINIYNNSEDMVFTLNVKANGYIKRPQIAVKQSESTVNSNGEYSFSEAILVTKTDELTFTIMNTGEADLTFNSVDNPVTIGNDTNNFFNVRFQPTTPTVAPGEETTFTILFKPTAIGNFSAEVTIATNSQNYGGFTFRIMGDGRDYIIGDEGPGGGIVFYAAGGQYKECSGDIAPASWNDAITMAGNYNGGNFSNWKLPDSSDLRLVCEILHEEEGLGNFKDSYYWSSQEYSATQGNIYSFAAYLSPRSNHADKALLMRFCAVRDFTL